MVLDMVKRKVTEASGAFGRGRSAIAGGRAWSLIQLREDGVCSSWRCGFVPARGRGCGHERLRSSVEGHLVDALALRGDEGRGTLRKAAGRGEHPLIRGSPNGETHPLGGIAVPNP